MFGNLNSNRANLRKTAQAIQIQVTPPPVEENHFRPKFPFPPSAATSEPNSDSDEEEGDDNWQDEEAKQPLFPEVGAKQRQKNILH